MPMRPLASNTIESADATVEASAGVAVAMLGSLADKAAATTATVLLGTLGMRRRDVRT